ncbi:hypothetical protein [Pedobacter aquatilis]|uniref:hypothetical protein n=1 Tax=Pedobacter aquatilis TaxID=351343 RepID=UPI00292E0F86|nr:hypothetical protein [Pedobacter aquatilis]
MGSTVKAQQAKAYKTIYYFAKTDNATFRLKYADGYPAGSEIQIYQAKKPTQYFLPESGETDQKGMFIFRSDTGAGITLAGITEDMEMLKAIKANYFFKGKTQKLLFQKSKLR